PCRRFGHRLRGSRRARAARRSRQLAPMEAGQPRPRCCARACRGPGASRLARRRTTEGSRVTRSAVFEGVPDFRSELVRAAVDAEIVWSEWRWRGTQSDGAPLDMASVMVCGVRDGRMVWARLYMEPVEQAGAGIAAAVRGMTGEP